MRERGDKEHDDCRHGGNPQPGIDGSEQGKRSYRKREDGQHRPFAGVGNKDGNGAAIDSPSDGADKVVYGRLQRAPDAHLRDDHGGQYGPQRQAQPRKLCDREGERSGKGDANCKLKMRAVAVEPNANQSPEGRDAIQRRAYVRPCQAANELGRLRRRAAKPGVAGNSRVFTLAMFTVSWVARPWACPASEADAAA